MALKVPPKNVHPKPAAKATHATGAADIKPAVAKPVKPAVTAQGDHFVQGAKPQAPSLAPKVRAAAFGSAAALVGGNVVTTAAVALDLLVKMHATSPTEAAKAFQDMARKLLVPNKGNE